MYADTKHYTTSQIYNIEHCHSSVSKAQESSYYSSLWIVKAEVYEEVYLPLAREMIRIMCRENPALLNASHSRLHGR